MPAQAVDPTDDPSASLPNRPRVGVIVVAGGSGQRFGCLKQFEYLPHTGQRVIDRSVDVAIEVAAASDGTVAVVVPADHVAPEEATFVQRYGQRVSVVAGGATRSASVRAGLAALAPDTSIVCVHDAARPFATLDLYNRVIAAVGDGADGAVPGVAMTDTVKLVDDDGWIEDTPDRDLLRAVQTPQAFNADMLRRAHAADSDGSDDAVLVEQIGGRVLVAEGDRDNIKITHPDDLSDARDPSWPRSAQSSINTNPGAAS